MAVFLLVEKGITADKSTSVGGSCPNALLFLQGKRLTLSLPAGRGRTVLDGPKEVLVSNVADVPSAIASLQPGETLGLAMEDFRLSSTLFITASDVAIRGAHGKTRVLCPDEGGAFLITGTNVTLDRLDISGCTNGSAVAVEGSNKTLADGEAAQCSTTSQSDVGACQWSVILRDCSFHGNRAENGSAVHAIGGSAVRIEKSTFEDSFARVYGGLIFVEKSSLIVENSFFKRSSSEKGGAVCSDEGSVAFSNCLFHENSAADDGGAVRSDGGSVEFGNCTFRGNQAARGGGAVHSCQTGEPQLHVTSSASGLPRHDWPL